jgi:sugar phosphate isomerase/epimerase
MVSRIGAIASHLASPSPVAAEPQPWVFSGFADEAGGSIEEQIDAHKAAGMSHIDIRNCDGFNITALPLDVAEQVKAKMDAAGMHVCMFGSPIGKIDVTDDIEIDLDKLRHLAKLIPIFGTNKVRMFSYHNKNDIPADEFERAAVERVGQLKALAKELGLALYHENEKGIYGEQLEATLNLLKTHRDGETFFGIFDASNFNQSGDDCWVNWQALRDYTDALHLKDSDDDGAHTPVGQGNGYYQLIMDDLVKRGWTGPVVLEPHLQNSPAVVSTVEDGLGLKANQSLADLSQAAVYQVAADAAKDCMAQAGAAWR